LYKLECSNKTGCLKASTITAKAPNNTGITPAKLEIPSHEKRRVFLALIRENDCTPTSTHLLNHFCSSRNRSSCNNINAMDNLSDFGQNHFSLRINACFPDSHCVGVATTLIFLTNGDQKTNVYSTKDRKTHYDIPYIQSVMLYANDELCLVRENNKRIVVYKASTWRDPEVLK